MKVAFFWKKEKSSVICRQTLCQLEKISKENTLVKNLTTHQNIFLFDGQYHINIQDFHEELENTSYNIFSYVGQYLRTTSKYNIFMYQNMLLYVGEDLDFTCYSQLQNSLSMPQMQPGYNTRRRAIPKTGLLTLTSLPM